MKPTDKNRQENSWSEEKLSLNQKDIEPERSPLKSSSYHGSTASDSQSEAVVIPSLQPSTSTPFPESSLIKTAPIPTAPPFESSKAPPFESSEAPPFESSEAPPYDALIPVNIPIGAPTFSFMNHQQFSAEYSIAVDCTSEGYISTDYKLNHDSHYLQLFVENFSRIIPGWEVNIRGTHEETRTRLRTSSDGRSTSTEYYTETVVDFHYSIPLHDYIDSSYSPLVQEDARSIGATGPSVAVSSPYERSTLGALQLIANYVRNNSPVKQLILTKIVHYDLGALESLIEARIRQLGYFHHVRITFPFYKNKVKVRQRNLLTFFSQELLGKIICIVSCMWIIFLPFYWITKYCCYKSVDETGAVKRLSCIFTVRPPFHEAPILFASILPQIHAHRGGFF